MLAGSGSLIVGDQLVSGCRQCYSALPMSEYEGSDWFRSAKAEVKGHRVQKVYTYTIYAFKLKKIPGTG